MHHDVNKGQLREVRLHRDKKLWKLTVFRRGFYAPSTASTHKTFPAALAELQTLWEREQPDKPERREIPESCRPETCTEGECGIECPLFETRMELAEWIRQHNARRVGTSHVYEAQR